MAKSAQPDLLKQTVKKSGKKDTDKKTTKKDDRWTINVEGQDEKDITELCELAFVNGEIKTPLERFAERGKDLLFNHWSEKFWNSRTVPDNPRVVVFKMNNGQRTKLADMRLLFQVKFRSNGLQKVLPNAEELDENETSEERLITMLVQTVGMKQANAKKFVNGEVKINDRITLAKTIDQLYYSSDKHEKSVGKKLLEYFNLRSKTGKANAECLTDDEIDRIGGLIATKQEVVLKNDVKARVHTYCESLEEFRKLVKFLNVTFQIGNYEFGLADLPAERNKRLCEAVSRYIGTGSGSGDDEDDDE